jgi:hypothetical protein
MLSNDMIRNYRTRKGTEGWTKRILMIYRGPGYLAVVFFATPSLPSVSSTGDTQED